MKEQSGTQLIRQGAYTAVGAILVYGIVTAALQVIQSRKSQPAQQPCGCAAK